MRIDQLTKEVTLTEYEYKKLIMAQEELLAKIKAEIERLKTVQLKRIQEGDLVDAEPYDKNEAYNDLLSFLSTLELEKPLGEEYAIEIGKYTHTLRIGSQSDIDNLIRQEKQEQPEVELEERICSYDKNEAYNELLDFLTTLEPEKPMQEGLEEEILNQWEDYPHDKWPKCPYHDFANIARHFAKWGAEHLADARKISQEDLEEAAWDCVLDSVDVNNPVLLPKYKELLTYLFIAGAKWQKEQMMKDYPKWRRIKAGERLPCPAYVWTIAYDNYPDCFEGRLMPNIQGVKVGRDTWYLPVDVIHNLPKEDKS